VLADLRFVFIILCMSDSLFMKFVYVKVQSFLHFPIPRNFPNFPGLVKEIEEQKCMCDLSYSKNHACSYST
jgi:hypothetical protein